MYVQIVEKLELEDILKTNLTTIKYFIKNKKNGEDVIDVKE